MKNRRISISNSSSISIELFPFLSVLACTIGSLVLLIIVVTAQTMGNQRVVTIIARAEEGAVNVKSPHYVECLEDGVILHPEEEFVDIDSLAQPDSPLSIFLSNIAERSEQEYLIMAVRPDGIETFYQIRELAREMEIDFGYEPIDEGWKLRFSN